VVDRRATAGPPTRLEFAEYITFIRNSDELETAYTDTLGDLALGLSGSVVAAAVTALRREPPVSGRSW
jgi:hypothetical protein